ncbi:MAG TPA: hypothetical protein ENH87_14390 [Pricia antarctica]|uniref:Uncharacterized protein n=1 Tax=Pricia antarctica TaxID=641691 RepID=A0A831QRS5_9FLAO|nr:hypothetical protein [Pricia antarctica]
MRLDSKRFPKYQLQVLFRIVFLQLQLSCSSDNPTPESPTAEEGIEKPEQPTEPEINSEPAILSKVDTYSTTVEGAGAVQLNFDQWPVLGYYIWPNNFIGKPMWKKRNI